MTTKIILVSFRSGSSKGYAYFTDIEDLEVGDHVEVLVRDELKEVLVISIDPTEAEAAWASKSIIRKIEPDEVQESIVYDGENRVNVMNFVGLGSLGPSSTLEELTIVDSKGLEEMVYVGDLIERRADGLTVVRCKGEAK